ncbi:hypothetical protein MBLNU230_g0013t1 [Neophaeotheca triangularis]
MAAAVGKFAANKLLSKQFDKYKDKKVESGEDPFFATVADPKKPGQTKKVKKHIPSYIPEKDALILAKVRKRAYRLDMCLFTFLGIRFGWSSVIGIIPGVGDVIGMLLALMVFRKCCKVEGGLDNATKLKMLFFVAFDFGIGLVPFVGDLADAAYKCNTRNARELERVLDKRYKPEGYDSERTIKDDEARKKRRKSGIYAPNDPPPATVFDDFDDEESDRRAFVNQGRRDDRRGGARRDESLDTYDRRDDSLDTYDRRDESLDDSSIGRPPGAYVGGSRRERRADMDRGGSRREARPSRQPSRRQENGSVRR